MHPALAITAFDLAASHAAHLSHLSHLPASLYVLLMSSTLLFGVVTATLTTTYAGPGESGSAYTKAESVSGNGLFIFDQSIPIGTNTHYAFALVRAQMQSMTLIASTDCDVYTNAASGGSPTDHIVLKAGQVYNWSLSRDTLTAGPGLVKVPISADITAGIYVTNAAICVLKIRAVLAG